MRDDRGTDPASHHAFTDRLNSVFCDAARLGHYLFIPVSAASLTGAALGRSLHGAGHPAAQEVVFPGKNSAPLRRDRARTHVPHPVHPAHSEVTLLSQLPALPPAPGLALLLLQ